MTVGAEERARSEYWVIFSGRLWRRAGSGRTTSGQPRRAAMSLMCAARAPQAMTSIERELVDEPVVEVGAVGELDIPHLLEEGQGGGAFADGEQGHLGAFAGDVPGGDHAADRDGGMLTAGLFLREFVPDGVRWAHLDIAGPSFNGGEAYGYTPKGGTGIAVRTLVQVAEDVADGLL